MTTARDQLTMIKEKLAAIRAEIERLLAQEEVLTHLLQEMSGQPAPTPPRKRSPNIKPLVLDIMHEAGFTGATTAEVDEMVRRKVPTVAKDSVGSILSRLKSAGALVHDGERYYEKQFAPKPQNPFEGLKAVI